MAVRSATRERVGIQSIEVGTPLLTTLAQRGAAMSLTMLATAVGMSASKAHKYLTSFARIGLVRQEGANGLYDLGPLAVEFGLAALRRIDVVELAHPPMQDLQSRLGETVTLTIWNPRGPTTVRVIENGRPVVVTVKLGGVLPLLTSSNGRVFLSWLDRTRTASLVEEELGDPGGPAWRAGLRTRSDVDAVIEATRHRGLAEVRDLVVPGIYAFSAPVWGPNGLAGAMTVVGIMGEGDVDTEDGPQLLLEATRTLSRQIGGRFC